MQSPRHSVTAVLVVVLVAEAEALIFEVYCLDGCGVRRADRGRAEPRSEGVVCVDVYVRACTCLNMCLCVYVRVCACEYYNTAIA